MFHLFSGQGLQLAIQGLYSLEQFIRMAAAAQSEREILQTLTHKLNHSRKIAQHFIRNALKDHMYT